MFNYARAAVAAAVFGALAFAVVPSASFGATAYTDNARILAGLHPDGGGRLAGLTIKPAWRRHARNLDRAWTELGRRQLAPIAAWSKANLDKPSETLLYMFGGPDFLYANAFFPSARTYVLVGLEPVGTIPNMAAIPPSLVPETLRRVERSLGTLISFSFFRTKDMKETLSAGRIRGTLPLLFVFLARAGQTIDKVDLVTIKPDGELLKPGEIAPKGASPAARIGFHGTDKKPRTLYYVQTDLSNYGLARSGFLAFLKRLEPADAFVKSASYLMHKPAFSRIRDFLLSTANTLVQDDSGIPLRFLQANRWKLEPFGRYLGPIDVFPQQFQPAMREYYRKSNPKPIAFGIGYRWRATESNLLLATSPREQKPATD